MSTRSIAVIFGGASSEYEVSLRSAAFIISCIDQSKYNLHLIGITKEGRWLLFTGDQSLIISDRWQSPEHCRPVVISPDRTDRCMIVFSQQGYEKIPLDCVFPVLHGKNGEDGTLQGLLELSGIPFVGCDTVSSALCMDKAYAKTILEANDIPTAPWRVVKDTQLHLFNEIERELNLSLGYPMFVKPANAGSSVGVSKAADKASLFTAFNLAFEHDRKLIVEKSIKGAEVECAVLGNDEPVASPIGEIVPAAAFYDYNAKYLDDTTSYYIPAHITEADSKNLRQTACAAYKALGCEGLARVDFFLLPDGGIILNEVNTLPGFTSISMYPKLFEHSGLDGRELVGRLIELAFERK